MCKIGIEPFMAVAAMIMGRPVSTQLQIQGNYMPFARAYCNKQLIYLKNV